MKKLFMVLIITLLSIGLFPLSVFTISSTPSLGADANYGKVFEENGYKYVLWGVDADSWGCRDGNTNMFHEHCDALNYVNANAIAIPICWKTIETSPDVYNFWYVDQYINMAKDHGLKATILWLGIDYAAGDNSFIPDYMINDIVTYNRCVGSGFSNNSILCPSNPNTKNRERLAYMAFLDHLKNNNPSNTVMAVCYGGENNYLKGLSNQSQPEQDIRCRCGYCNSLYANQGNVVFMEQQYALYAKYMIDWGKTIYDIPAYSQVCAFNYWPNWRYAENGSVIKTTVNRQDHFVAPSIVATDSVNNYVSEMNHFTASQISGNNVFTDGIDTGWSSNQTRIEIAPWFNTMWYGGLGAFYWDNPSSTNIRTNSNLRDKLRKYWGPLKGIEFYLARLKTMGSKRFWWWPGSAHTWGGLTNFSADQVSSGNDYGVCFELGPTDITFTGSTYSGQYTFTISRAGGWSGYSFQRGYYQPDTGIWMSQGSVSPSINGDNAVLTVSGDSGDYANSVYRFYK